MTWQKICATAIALAAVSGGAQAATYSASEVIDSTYGACTASTRLCTVNDRKTVTNALGESDDAFYSLGLGGDLTVGFGLPVIEKAVTLTLKEVTFGGTSSGGHFEAVDVYTVLGGVTKLVGTVLNVASTTTLSITDSFEYIKLVDVTKSVYPSTKSYDGFDVESITIAPIPVPASVTLLLAGIGGLGLMRRRKSA